MTMCSMTAMGRRYEPARQRDTGRSAAVRAIRMRSPAVAVWPVWATIGRGNTVMTTETAGRSRCRFPSASLPLRTRGEGAVRLPGGLAVSASHSSEGVAGSDVRSGWVVELGDADNPYYLTARGVLG